MNAQVTKNKKHTHARATMQDKWLKTTRYEHTWVDNTRAPNQLLDALEADLSKYFVVTWYDREFSRDLNGDTTYFKIKYKFSDTEDRLTVHVFSCYCEDFVEGDKPPF